MDECVMSGGERWWIDEEKESKKWATAGRRGALILANSDFACTRKHGTH
jgi:hypothetical protein